MSIAAARDILGQKLCAQHFLKPISFESEVLTIGHPQSELSKELRETILQRIPHSAIKVQVTPNEDIEKSLDGAWPASTESNFSPEVAKAFETALDEASEELTLAPNPLGENETGGTLRLTTSNQRRIVKQYTVDEFEGVRVTLAQRAFAIDDPDKKQRGHLSEIVDGRHVFMRVLGSPAGVLDGRNTAHTQLRVLRPYYLLPGLQAFGFAEMSMDLLLTYSGRAATHVVIAAPPGNGKTSLAYRLILNFPFEEQNGFTIEWPIEVFLPDGITQKRITKDFTREDAVEQILGMSPSWVFVGESLDDSTAQLTAKVMATGIPTLTSNHAEDGLGIPERMIKQGVRPDAAARANLLVATRLLPELCPECRVRPKSISKQMQDLLETDKLSQADVFTRGTQKGCTRCKDRRTIGRRGVGEVFVVDEAGKRLIEQNDMDKFRKYMASFNLPTMRGLALKRLAEGLLDERDFFANIPVGAQALPQSPTALPAQRDSNVA